MTMKIIQGQNADFKTCLRSMHEEEAERVLVLILTVKNYSSHPEEFKSHLLVINLNKASSKRLCFLRKQFMFTAWFCVRPNTFVYESFSMTIRSGSMWCKTWFQPIRLLSVKRSWMNRPNGNFSMWLLKLFLVFFTVGLMERATMWPWEPPFRTGNFSKILCFYATKQINIRKKYALWATSRFWVVLLVHRQYFSQ